MTAAGTPDYLTTAEVAEVMRCSSETVLRAIRRGDLQAFVNGRLRLVERSELQRYLAAHTTGTGQRARRRLRSTA